MDIKVTLILNREEVETYKKEYAEFNCGEIPTDDEVKEDFLEMFYGDCREYIIDCAEVYTKIED